MPGTQGTAERGVQCPAGQLDHEVGNPTGGDERNRGVDAALETPRGFGRQLMPAGRPRDRHGIERGGFDEHGAGR